MTRPPRILIIAARDCGGCLYYLCHELRRRSGLDIRLVNLTVDPDALFPADVHELYDGGQELRTLIEGADVFHIVDINPFELILGGLSLGQWIDDNQKQCRVVLQIDGRTGAEVTMQLGKLANERAWSLISTRPDAARRFGGEFLPPFIPWWKAPWSPLVFGTRMRESLQRRVTVFASSREAIDRRPKLEALVDAVESTGVPGLIVETVVGIPHRNVLRRRRLAHLCLTTSKDGLSLSALEAMGQGVPVVADLSRESALDYARLAGGELPPIINSAEIVEVVTGLDSKSESDLKSVEWARAMMNPIRWNQHCKQLWGVTRKQVA